MPCFCRHLISRPLQRCARPHRWLGLLLPLLQVAAPAGAVAPPDLGPCVHIDDDAARLACYDQQVGRAAAVALPASPAAPAAMPPGASGSAPAPAPPAAPSASPSSAEPAVAADSVPQASDSFLSRYWELDAVDKRGTFNYTGYHPNFFLPVHYMAHVNQVPYSPSRGAALGLPTYQRAEGKLQISLRTKIVQDLLLPRADLWVGYTQQSLWQVWNHAQSAPFRNTDYQPELMYMAPTPHFLRGPVLGWSWRLSQLGLLHQSNGQSGALSRSWNRSYALVGVERGDVSATLRLEKRLGGGNPSSDDNPDIVHYMGWSQLQIAWTPGLSAAALTWRPSLGGRGSVQLDWTYPLDSRQPDGLRGYVQLFHGYGETILDYNFRQTSLGIGLTIFKF